AGAVVPLREAACRLQPRRPWPAGLAGPGALQGVAAAVAVRAFDARTGGGAGRPAVVPPLLRAVAGGGRARPYRSQPLPWRTGGAGAAGQVVLRTRPAVGEGGCDVEAGHDAGRHADRGGVGAGLARAAFAR